ncbi:Golgi transport complex subunit 5-domain-containing protein [Staphylotrichum tortipilum]|uniref:Conserved oligomeric Golgi complex subunit 5 n=1 Tax=Staphylotrichum tortipilum TaxID=2831512 RepID=A0AAN6MJG1_9PEZI|nr:Golgi transport complex subunit 5-domain-containing protein [Staphylotrichum longicolle]
MTTPPLPAPGDATEPSSSSDPSYIDYEAFLSPTFHPPSFANTLVLATNNPSDTPLDLSTPLSRVLFDIQEIDSHIHTLTTRSALPLVDHTTAQTAASTALLASLQAQLTALNETHATLAREVSGKYTAAEEVRTVASRLHAALRLCRAVSRYLTLARQLEAQLSELTGAATATTTTSSSSARAREDHRALTRCAHTLLSLGETLTSEPGLDRVTTVRAARDAIVAPAERTIREIAERMVREFSMGSSTATFAQGEESRARTVSALSTLYLLSPLPSPSTKQFTPTLMLHALDTYLRAALQSSIASLSRALATLPSLERTLAEISARCQNVVALEAVLEGTRAPAHPLLSQQKQQQQQAGNLLQPLLAYLETGSLPSYFWRTLAGSMTPRVQEIVSKGGLPARTLRANRQSVGEAVTECVRRGCRLPSGVAAAAKGKGRGGGEEGGKQWEREVAVMVGSVVNNLGR